MTSTHAKVINMVYTASNMFGPQISFIFLEIFVDLVAFLWMCKFPVVDVHLWYITFYVMLLVDQYNPPDCHDGAEYSN